MLYAVGFPYMNFTIHVNLILCLTITNQREERIEQSVGRMMTVIDLARNIRERHNKPLKTPLMYVVMSWCFIELCYYHYKCMHFDCSLNCREMVVVHLDADFLEDITGKLREVCDIYSKILLTIFDCDHLLFCIFRITFK